MLENLEGHQNRTTDSQVLAILLKGKLLPIGEVASGRVCGCSLRRRLVYSPLPVFPVPSCQLEDKKKTIEAQVLY